MIVESNHIPGMMQACNLDNLVKSSYLKVPSSNSTQLDLILKNQKICTNWQIYLKPVYLTFTNSYQLLQNQYFKGKPNVKTYISYKYFNIDNFKKYPQRKIYQST